MFKVYNKDTRTTPAGNPKLSHFFDVLRKFKLKSSSVKGRIIRFYLELVWTFKTIHTYLAGASTITTSFCNVFKLFSFAYTVFMRFISFYFYCVDKLINSRESLLTSANINCLVLAISEVMNSECSEYWSKYFGNVCPWNQKEEERGIVVFNLNWVISLLKIKKNKQNWGLIWSKL